MRTRLAVSAALTAFLVIALGDGAQAQIVPPFSSFTPAPTMSFIPPHPRPPFPPPVPFPFWGLGSVVESAPAQPSNVNVVVNPAPAPPPVPVVYNPQTAETTSAGIEIVRCMSTSPAQK